MHRTQRVWRLYACAMEHEALPIIDYYKMIRMDDKNIERFNVDRAMFGNKSSRVLSLYRVYISPDNMFALVITGIGKVNAASSLSYFLNCLNPKEVVNIGTCGNGSKIFSIGDLLRVVKVIQYDVSVPLLNQEFEELRRPVSLSNRDKMLKSESFLRLPDVTLGTGDRFATISDQSDDDAGDNRIHVYDMEGYAIARVCRDFGINLKMFKFISDNIFEVGNHEQFDRMSKDSYSLSITNLLRSI